MRYAEARPLIASGDLLAFANGGLVSRLIRTWCGGSYSHVGIAWRFDDRLFVLSAKEGGYGVCLLALSEQVPFFWLRTGVTWTRTLRRFATMRLGKPYSYEDCALVALGRKPRHDDQVCSVYAATILQAAGLDLPLPSYTPSALVGALMSLGADMHTVLPDPVPTAG